MYKIHWISVVFMFCLLFGQVFAQTVTPVPTFIVTSSVTGGGFIDPSAAVIDQGSGKLFRFIPAAGNIVADVTLDGVSVMSQVTVSSSTGYGTFRLENVQAGHTITATFIPDPTPPSTVTATFTGSGAVEPAVYQLKNGKTKTFTFTASPGSILSNVTLDGTSIMDSVKLNSDRNKGTYQLAYSVGNHAFTATFTTDPTPPSTIMATATGNGTVEPATYILKVGKYKSFTFTAIPGSILSDVRLDGVSVMSAVKLTNYGEKGTYRLDYATGDHTIAATFSTDPTPPSTITATATGPGTVEPATYLLRTGKYKTFKLTATPGNVVQDVRVDGVSVMSAVTLTNGGEKGSYRLDYTTGNHTIAATFAVDPTPPSNITATATGSGTVEPATYVLKVGKYKSFKFTATPGSILSDVRLDGVSVMSAVTLTSGGEKGTYRLDYATGDHTIAATFSTDPTPPSNVTCSWSGQGIVDPSLFTLTEGKTKTLTIIPVTGHQIQEVLVNGTSVLGQVTTTSTGKGTYKLNYSPTSQTVTVTFVPKS